MYAKSRWKVAPGLFRKRARAQKLPQLVLRSQLPSQVKRKGLNPPPESSLVRGRRRDREHRQLERRWLLKLNHKWWKERKVMVDVVEIE